MVVEQHTQHAVEEEAVVEVAVVEEEAVVEAYKDTRCHNYNRNSRYDRYMFANIS